MSKEPAARIRAGLVALVALICALLPTISPAHADPIAPDPLTLTIDTMTTSASGDIQLTGRITNVDDQPWRDINIIPFLSNSPIQTTSGLAQATKTPANVAVGDRKPEVFTALKELAPDETASWSLTVPKRIIPSSRGGAYWFGVHALGTDSAGVVSKNADGRARTFLPVVGQTKSPARVHVIVEITERMAYGPQGHLMGATSDAGDAPRWADEFRGHLMRLLSVVNHTPGADLLVDPAVVDAAAKLADGNPGWLGEGGALADTKAAAQAWLTAFKAIGRTHRVWALPYGDVDIAAIADRPDLIAAAESAALAPLQALGLHAEPARRSPDLAASLAVVSGGAGSTAFVDSQIAGPLADANGVHVVGTAQASFGGPQPGDPYAVVPLRQQILAEAALHVGTTAPVVVLIPSAFSPADPTGFARDLAQPYVSLVSLPQALEGRTAETFPEQPEPRPETPLVQLSTTSFDQAAARAATLHALTSIDVVGPVTRSALTGLSRANVHGPAAQNLSFQVGDLGRQIAVTAPPGVSLSGSSGRFSVSVENKLPVAVTVALKTSTDPDTSISHTKTIALGARGSVSVLVNASVATHGNHRVEFALTDVAGHPTGVSATVTVRSVQVSGVIWGFIFGGVGLLGLAIAMRLIRRIRSHR